MPVQRVVWLYHIMLCVFSSIHCYISVCDSMCLIVACVYLYIYVQVILHVFISIYGIYLIETDQGTHQNSMWDQDSAVDRKLRRLSAPPGALRRDHQEGWYMNKMDRVT